MLERKLKPLTFISAHDEIQDRIKQYILDNKLRPDAPLPTESQLSEQIGVSRPAVREALRSLESLGIIYSRRGEGRFVSSFTLDPVLENLNYSLLFDTEDLRQMIEVREQLEAGFVGKAITNMDHQTLEELRDLMRQIREQANARGYFLDTDLAFHSTIYRSVGNRVLTKLLDVFCEIYKNLRDKSLLSSHDPEAEVVNHERILQAIEAKDIPLAQERIIEHFSRIKERIRTAQPSHPK